MDHEIRILLVDDDEDDHLLTRDLLNETTLTPTLEWASSFETGRDRINRAAHDVYLIDYRLGESDGLELLRHALARGISAPLIILTGAGDREVDMKALKMGAADYLVKGRLSPDLLERSIRYAMEHKRNEEMLFNARERLETRVAERTAQLTDMNKALNREIEDRKQVERKLNQREKQLSASEERYRIICEKASDGIAVLQRGKVAFANPALTAIIGVQNREPTDAELQSLFPKIPSKRIMACLGSMGHESPADSFEVSYNGARGGKTWTEWHLSPVQWEGEPACLATVRNITEAKKRESAIESETEHLRASYNKLMSSLKAHYRFGDIVGKSAVMQAVYESVLSASQSDAHVVIEGESGTGKELVARAIHNLSNRSDKPFVPVNCGAIPETLFESEFFGHKKGAFTGANVETYGFFGLSQGGTLFLDEVAELTLNMQVKLLRAIEGGGYSQMGGNAAIDSDVRIMAATNRNLVLQVEKGAMREDFFYRIHVVGIQMPPLRERKDDIPLLIDHFTRKHYGSDTPPDIPGNIIGALCSHHWPGNVRELQNVLNRYFAVNRLDFLDSRSPSIMPNTAEVAVSPEDLNLGLREALLTYEKRYISRVLEMNRWHKGKAAAALGIPERTFYRKLKKLKLI